MSQSPLIDEDVSSSQIYQRGWRDLYQMLRAGKSLSGREQNCCFLNTGGEQRFADVSAISGFDYSDDARALALIDWDRDGDLDVWVSNRTAPRVRLLSNTNSSRNHFLQVRLVGATCNRDAIGARLEVYTDSTPVAPYVQTVRAGEGFLSQSSRWIHFGLGEQTRIARLLVRWPGDTEPERFDSLEVDKRYEVVQGTGRAVPSAVRPVVSLPPSKLAATTTTDRARAIVCGRIPIPPLPYTLPDGKSATWSPRGPTILNLWGTDCRPCLEELTEWSKRRDVLDAAAVNVLALCVDSIAATETTTESQLAANAQRALEQMQFPFSWGLASEASIAVLELTIGALFDDARPFPIPTSFLLDRDGCVVAVYRGGVAFDQLTADLALLDASPDIVRTASTPFAGRWLGAPPRPQPWTLATSLEQQLPDAVEPYLRHLIDVQTSPQRSAYWNDLSGLAKSYLALATKELQRGDAQAAMKHFQRCLERDPDNFAAHANMGSLYFRLGQWPAAATSFTIASRLEPQNANLRVNLGLTQLRLNQLIPARKEFAAALELDARDVRAKYNLARVETALGNDLAAVQHLEDLAAANPRQIEVQHDLAWLLATSAEATVRDGPRAVQLATAVCQSAQSSGQPPSPVMLRTLAAAQAEAGQFESATATLERAIVQAKSQGNEQLTSQLSSLAQRVQNKQPIRRRSPKSS